MLGVSNQKLLPACGLERKKSFNQFITISGGQLCPFPIQIQKRANYSSFSPIREGFWSLFANSQSNFIQFYYSTNKIPINRYFSDKKTCKFA